MTLQKTETQLMRDTIDPDCCSVCEVHIGDAMDDRHEKCAKCRRQICQECRILTGSAADLCLCCATDLYLAIVKRLAQNAIDRAPDADAKDRVAQLLGVK